MGSGGSLEANVSLVEGNENIQPQKEDMASFEVSHRGFPLCTCSLEERERDGEERILLRNVFSG